MIIGYSYQIEFDSTKEPNLEGILLPLVERELNSKLLSTPLFESACSIGAVRRERRWRELARRSSRRLGEAIGISPHPEENVMTHVPCQTSSINDTENDCAVVKGGLTISISGTESNEKNTTQQAIRDIMQEGDLNGIHDAIVQITFLLDDSSSASVMDHSPHSIEDEKQGKLTLFVYVFVALGGATIVMITAYFVINASRLRPLHVNPTPGSVSRSRGEIDRYVEGKPTLNLSIITEEEEDLDEEELTSSRESTRAEGGIS